MPEVAATQKPKPQTAPGVCPFTTRELAGKILIFCEQLNGIEFYSYQRVLVFRVIESLLLNDGSNITALLSRQSGKSECVASAAIGICIIVPRLAETFPNDQRLASFRHGVWVGVFAPKLELSGPIYEKIRSRAESERAREIMGDPELAVGIVQSRGDSMAFSNGSIVRASTASEQSMQEGKTYHLIIIDEAQKVSRSKVAKELAPMLAATCGTMLKIGTAWMSRGGFHEDIQRNINHEQKTNVRNHFQFDYKQVIAERRALFNRQKKDYEAGTRKSPPDAFHLNYEKWMASELARLNNNTDSEEFKMNFRLLWQESRSIAIKESDIQAGALPSSEMNSPKSFGYQYAGLDVAKTNDSTVLTIVEVDKTNPIIDPVSRGADGEPIIYYPKYILAWLELQGSFEGHQYEAITSFLRNYNVQFMLVDSTGIGDPVCERLQVLLGGMGISVEPYRLTAPSKSDLFKLYLQEWVANRVRYPAGEMTIKSMEYSHFESQHIELEREWNGSYLQCSGPEGSHDDYPVSGALAVWASKQVVEAIPTVEVENVSLYGNPSNSNRVASSQGGRASRYTAGRRRH